jgi:uncharacterized protein YunC (DUF1805 family)
MEEHVVVLEGKQVKGYVVPLGPVNLVFGVAEGGMIGCGAFAIGALDTFGYAAAKIRGVDGKGIATVDDLLEGTVVEVNVGAVERGVQTGMTGRMALGLM